MTEEEFFDFVQTRDERWELVEGEAVMIAGTNQRHQDIRSNTLTSLHTQLRGKPCRTTAADTGVSTSTGTVRYPDVVVDCGRRDDQSMLATEPVVVIEVVSPSTRGFDSHRKVLEYRSKPEIAHILLIYAENACVLHHFRDGEGWRETMYDASNDVIKLPKIGAKLALNDIYYG